MTRAEFELVAIALQIELGDVVASGVDTSFEQGFVGFLVAEGLAELG